MVPTWFNVFFWGMGAFVLLLLLFEDKLLELEAEYDERKEERRERHVYHSDKGGNEKVG